MDGSSRTSSAAAVRMVAEVQALPYRWPAVPDGASAAAAGAGSCASKHALLRERLSTVGVDSRPLFVVGPLVPEFLAADPEFVGGVSLLEVHECLTVTMPDVGAVRVDVTWDPPLVERGLAGTLGWRGTSDMALAVGDSGPGWSPDPANLRFEKEALRARLYSPADRAIRDRVLAALSRRFCAWRASAPAPGPARRGAS